VRMRAPGPDGPPVEFVELGRGAVDLPAVFAALRAVGFRGWAVVEGVWTMSPTTERRHAGTLSTIHNQPSTSQLTAPR
jgi:sugar phosphate isomerase/epimerase